MYKDVAQYVKDCPQCQVAKGPSVGSKTQPGSIIANGPLDLLLWILPPWIHQGTVRKMSWS